MTGSVETAFLVHAHAAPTQFGRTVRQLLEVPAAGVTVHLDAKVDDAPFRALVRSAGDVSFTPARTQVTWGGFSQVVATLANLREALRRYPAAQRFCLVSGDTYLLRDPRGLAAFFARSPAANYINCLPFPAPGAGKPANRLSGYHREDPGPSRVSQLWWHGVQRVVRRPWRHRLEGLRPYTGSAWWCITREAAEYLDRASRRMTTFAALCRTSSITDELWFQTLLMNSPLADTIRPAIMLTHWDRGAQSPRIFDLDELDLLTSADLNGVDRYGPHDYYFVRKFRDEDGRCDERLRDRWWTAAR